MSRKTLLPLVVLIVPLAVLVYPPVVFVYPLVVLVCSFVCLIVSVCPPIVLVWPLVCPLVVLVVLSAGLFITDQENLSLFDKTSAWVKKGNNSLFDVTIEPYDEAKICELVAHYLLNR